METINTKWRRGSAKKARYKSPLCISTGVLKIVEGVAKFSILPLRISSGIALINFSLKATQWAQVHLNNIYLTLSANLV